MAQVVEGGEYKNKFNFSSLGDFIISQLKSGGSLDALINGQSNLKWTFKDILNETLKSSRTLHGFGVRRNDVIAIISENRHEIAAVTLGALCLNTIVAPISYTYTKRELTHALNLSQPKIIFVSQSCSSNVMNVCSELNFVKKIINFDENSTPDASMISLSEFYEKYEDKNFNVEAHVKNRVDIKRQTAMIFLSSGTTGPSKGVETTCENLFFVIDQYSESLLNSNRFEQRIIALNIAPFFHIMGFTNLFLILFSKRFCSVFLPKFEFNLFLKTIEDYKVATMTIPPPVVILLAKSEITEKFNLESLRMILCGAAPLSKDIEEQTMKKLKNVFVGTGYGLSEANIVIYNHDFKVPMVGSIGKLMKGLEAKIVSEHGELLGQYQVGEVCIRGPVVMKGYYKNPEATAATIKDGWLHTGDLGYFDEDKKFYIVDRLKELIKFKGYQVPPAELEGLLLSNPKIKDCGVIGIADESAGELPFAFVVKQPNVELSEEEVKNFVKENASNAKWLRGGVKFIEEIPKNPSGKILRRELRELFKSMRAKL